MDFDGKRDRWAGFDPESYKSVIEDHARVEEAKQAIKAAKLREEAITGVYADRDPDELDDDDKDDNDDKDKKPKAEKRMGWCTFQCAKTKATTLKQATKPSPLRNEIILDTGSTQLATFMNPDLVTDIKKSKFPLIMNTNAGLKVLN